MARDSGHSAVHRMHPLPSTWARTLSEQRESNHLLGLVPGYPLGRPVPVLDDPLPVGVVDAVVQVVQEIPVKIPGAFLQVMSLVVRLLG